MKLGLQLYNFRELLKEDFCGTLREIAKLGFDGVEFASFYGNMEPEELAGLLKELKLECAGTMFRRDLLADPRNPVWDMAKTLNSPAVTFSCCEDLTTYWPVLLDLCRTVGENAAEKGIAFSYHNHWQEFVKLDDGKSAMSRILRETDPKQVFIEPDVCWLTRSNIQPAEYIREYASRVYQVHLKDILIPEQRETMTPLGKGCVDLAGSIEAARNTPCKWLIYEQDHSEDPFADAVSSLSFLKKLGL